MNDDLAHANRMLDRDERVLLAELRRLERYPSWWLQFSPETRSKLTHARLDLDITRAWKDVLRL